MDHRKLAKKAAQARWKGKTTKVQAIAALIKDNGGKATWREIYEKIEKYYPTAKASTEWQSGIRGVVYREIRNGKTFKQLNGAIALK